MMTKTSHLAIIPARSGSKGLPGKNVRLLDGIPLMAYSILAAKNSNIFQTIILSTDSREYADIAMTYGAEIPWLRDTKLASDNAFSTDVVIDLLNRLSETGKQYTHFTLLQPTSPLRTSSDINEAWKLLQQKKASAVIGVSECQHPPQWCNILPEDLCMKDFIKPEAMVPRQNLEQQYMVNGAIYMSETIAFMKHKSFFMPDTYGYIMPPERSVDIDNEIDFLVAESLINLNKNKQP